MVKFEGLDIGLSNGRVTEKGKWVSKTRERRLIYEHYKIVVGKNKRRSLRRPNGQFASQREKVLWTEERHNVVIRAKGKPISAAPSGAIGTGFETGKFLSKVYFFNFFCRCKLSDDSPSPETYVAANGDRVKEHFYGYSTNSYSSDDIVRNQALVKHNQHYPDHKNFHFELRTRKVMQI